MADRGHGLVGLKEMPGDGHRLGDLPQARRRFSTKGPTAPIRCSRLLQQNPPRAVIRTLTYEVDALRALLLTDGASEYGLLLDFGILLSVSVVLTAIAAKLYGRMGY
jgi:hypothetical protein